MNPRTTGILLLVALALGAFVWFYEIEGEEARREAEAAEKRIFPEIEASDVEEVALTTRDGVSVRLRRGEQGWSLVEPLDFPADAFAADGIATNLAELASESVLDDPQPPEEYGLADGARVVRFRAAGEEQVLRLGDKAPIGGNSYATVEGRDAIVTVPTYQATSFDKSLTDLRERRILELDVSSIQSVEARWPDGSVTLERVEAAPQADAPADAAADDEGPAWRVVAPLTGRADDEVVQGLLSDLSFLRATGFVDEPSQEQRAALDTPAFEAVLRGRAPADGGEAPRHRLRIGPVYEGDKRLVEAGSPSLFVIPAERIDDFPRKLVSYRYKRLADFRIGDAAQVDFFFHPQSGDPVAVTARRGDEGWTASPEPLAAGRVARLVSELSALEAADIVSEQASEEELAELGLSPPRTIVSVFGEAEGETPEGETASLPRLAEIHIGEVEGSEWIIARAAGDPAVYRLGYELAEHLPVSLEAFRNRFARVEEEAPEPPPEDAGAGGLDFLSPSEESP